MAVGLSVALVALAAYLTVRHQLSATLDASLHRRAEISAQYDPSVYPMRNIPAFVSGATDTKVGYMLADGTAYLTPGPDSAGFPLGRPELAVARGSDAYSCRTISAGGVDYRVATVPTIREGVALVVGPVAGAQPAHAGHARPGHAALRGRSASWPRRWPGWMVARTGLRPVRPLTEAAEEIARTEQLDPIEVEGNDEIARLARAFNAMLAALSASRDRQRQLVADAGHELRTPADLPAHQPGAAEPGRPPGWAVGGVARTSCWTTCASRSRSSPRSSATSPSWPASSRPQVLLEPVDLAEITERAVQRVRRRASSLRFDLHAEPWFVVGEASALERAVTNLLDNAAKWSPPLGVVTVSLSAGPADRRRPGPRASRRRTCRTSSTASTARADSRTLPGSGLGLSIVRQVAERHGGSVHGRRRSRRGRALRDDASGGPGPARCRHVTAHPRRRPRTLSVGVKPAGSCWCHE